MWISLFGKFEKALYLCGVKEWDRRQIKMVKRSKVGCALLFLLIFLVMWINCGKVINIFFGIFKNICNFVLH